MPWVRCASGNVFEQMTENEIKNILNDIKYRRKIKTLPEAQRTQGIEFITQIIFMTEINLISSYLKEKKGISDSNTVAEDENVPFLFSKIDVKLEDF